jgi:outer membrane receptor protein involved in Fe transport
VIHITDRTREIDLGALQYDGQITRLEHVEVSARKETFVNSIDRKTYRVGTDIRSAGGSVSDLLQSIPSVLVDVEGNVSLRGDSSVLLLVDGKPSTQLSAANRADVLAQMSTDNLDRIEVITNPSAKFKPDGTAGIINLVTKRQELGGLSGSWRANLGNDSRGNAGLNLAYNRGPHGIFRQCERAAGRPRASGP